MNETMNIPNVAEANRNFDAVHGNPNELVRIRSGWNHAMMLRRGKLTDRKITQYENAGYYSAEFKEARRELQERRAKKRAERDGNFDIVDGRMIYRP